MCRLLRAYHLISHYMSSDLPIKISIIAAVSLSHMLVLLKNSDYGPGSLVPPATRHGSTLHASASLVFEAPSALIHVTSSDIAAVITYAVRSITNPRRECIRSRARQMRGSIVATPCCVLPPRRLSPSVPMLPPSTAANGVIAVSSWGAEGNVSTDYIVDIAAGAALDLANDMPPPRAEDDAVVGHAVKVCSSGLGRIFGNASAWGCSSISTRAMLPSLSCQSFHRFVLVLDARLRH